MAKDTVDHSALPNHAAHVLAAVYELGVSAKSRALAERAGISGNGATSHVRSVLHDLHRRGFVDLTSEVVGPRPGADAVADIAAKRASLERERDRLTDEIRKLEERERVLDAALRKAGVR